MKPQRARQNESRARGLDRPIETAAILQLRRRSERRERSAPARLLASDPQASLAGSGHRGAGHDAGGRVTSRANLIFTKRRRESRSTSKTPAISSTIPVRSTVQPTIRFTSTRSYRFLVSPGLMRRVVRTLDLEHNPDFFKGNPRKTINLANAAADGRTGVNNAGYHRSHRINCHLQPPSRRQQLAGRSERSETTRAVCQHDPRWSQSRAGERGARLLQRDAPDRHQVHPHDPEVARRS